MEELICLIDQSESDLQSKFITAIQFGNDHVVDLLLSRADFDPSFENNWALCEAIKWNRWTFFEKLIQNPKMDPSCHNNWLIAHCVFRGYEKAVKILLNDQRVDPTIDRNVCIRLAAKNGHLSIVEQLLADSRVDASCNDNRALQSSIFMFHLPIMLKLLNNIRVIKSLPVIGFKSFMQRQLDSVYVLGCTVSNTILVARQQLAELNYILIKKAILEFCIGASQLKLPSLLSFFITKMICEPFSNCDISMHSFFIVIDRVKLFSV